MKVVRLLSGWLEGSGWAIATKIQKDGSFINKGEIVLDNRHERYIRQKEHERIRRSDRYWVLTRIPASMAMGCEIHHDWNDGGRMRLIPWQEHRLLHKKMPEASSRIHTGICWMCSNGGYINSCGVCEECWDKFAFLRRGCVKLYEQ